MLKTILVLQCPENSPDLKLDDNQMANCVHKWTLVNAPGPHCSEDILRVMKSLQPILNQSLHVRKSTSLAAAGGGPAGAKDAGGPSKDMSFLSVQGPLTWREFHRRAGTATKGNTDDHCEPLPVPTISVSHASSSTLGKWFRP